MEIQNQESHTRIFQIWLIPVQRLYHLFIFLAFMWLIKFIGRCGASFKWDPNLFILPRQVDYAITIIKSV